MNLLNSVKTILVKLQREILIFFVRRKWFLVDFDALLTQIDKLE